MPWVTFFATRADLLDVIRFAAEDCGCRIVEHYSRFDEEPRELAGAGAAAGIEELGAAEGPHLGFWHPDASPPPRRRRIDLQAGAVPGHTHRYAVESCGLLTLQCRGVRGDLLVASALGWWTEASARAKAAPELRAADVRWAQLASLGRRFRHHVTRRLARGSAGGVPLLAGALDAARAGARLRDPGRGTTEIAVDP